APALLYLQHPCHRPALLSHSITSCYRGISESLHVNPEIITLPLQHVHIRLSATAPCIALPPTSMLLHASVLCSRAEISVQRFKGDGVHFCLGALNLSLISVDW
ncbi:MAG: hypothetical protein ACPG4U_17025, partial [Pseudomonadales bacterium]